MQIILLEKLANLGQLGDVVKVKDGYGRNFLIPQKKAKRATETNMAEFQAKRAELEKAQAEILVRRKPVPRKSTASPSGSPRKPAWMAVCSVP